MTLSQLFYYKLNFTPDYVKCLTKPRRIKKPPEGERSQKDKSQTAPNKRQYNLQLPELESAFL
jgi:hypothetical protein